MKGKGKYVKGEVEIPQFLLAGVGFEIFDWDFLGEISKENK